MCCQPSTSVCSTLIFTRLKELEIFSSRVSEAHSLYSGQPASTHLHDPINAFQLVNRYSNMWLKLQDNVYMENSKGKVVCWVGLLPCD